MKIPNIFSSRAKRLQVDLNDYIDLLISLKTRQLSIKKKAIEHAIDLIAKTISKSEIQLYRYNSTDKKVKPVKNDSYYYKLNVKPNPNELATTFFYNIICKLLREEECLIVEINNNLYLADSFQESDSILYEKYYYNIQLTDRKGNSLIVDKNFNSSNAIYLSLGESKVKECIDNYYEEFGKLLGVAISQYKSNNSPKWRLTPPGGQPAFYDKDTKKPISYEEYKNKLTKGLFDEHEAIVLLSDQIKLDKINGEKFLSSNDYRELEEKWEEEVAQSFNIPIDVFKGNKTDKSTGTNDFISFGVVPILNILEDGMNAVIIGYEKYKKGDRIYINKLNMKHFDIFDSATSLDKLFGDGFSHNDLRGFLSIPELDEEWANEHNVTKNYGNVSKKGGDENE